MDCLFCSIVKGEIPSKKVYEDDRCLAFQDIDPQAPVHLLLIPKEHIESLGALEAAHGPLMAHLLQVIANLADALDLQGGFRVVSNCGPDGGQTVPHLHFHLLGGRALAWPPG